MPKFAVWSEVISVHRPHFVLLFSGFCWSFSEFFSSLVLQNYAQARDEVTLLLDCPDT